MDSQRAKKVTSQIANLGGHHRQSAPLATKKHASPLSIALLYVKNMVIAVGICPLYCVHLEIHVYFRYMMAAILFLRLPVSLFETINIVYGVQHYST